MFASGYSVVRNCLIEENIAQSQAGGVYLDQGGLVTGCVIRANAAANGGAVYLHYSGTVTHSTLHSNSAANGAGAYLYWGGTVTNCDITWNWGQFDGGGVWFTFGGLVTDSRVQNNFADDSGGAGGGAVLAGGGILRRCDVSSNVAARGSGVFSQYNAQEAGMIDSCHIHRNLSPEGWGEGMGAGVVTLENDLIRNCLIEYNTSSNVVGGLLLGEDGVAENCTIVYNAAARRVGGVAVSAGAELRNCIVYYNTAPLQANWDVDYGFTVSHICTTPDSPDFENTITADPMLAGGGDCRLQSNSPCVNAGVNSGWMSGAFDFAGQPRIQHAVVDMGAYESAWWGMYADVDGDGFTDWTEVEVTGTDPTNASSFLGMMEGSVTEEAGGLVIRWQSVEGRMYHVDRSLDLTASPAFQPLMSNIAGQPGFTTVTDTTATAKGPYFYRVVVGSESRAPAQAMMTIPAGTFTMGDRMDTNQGYWFELPLHDVAISTFTLSNFEVTQQEWNETYDWALINGYAFDNPGVGKTNTHPITTINWYDAIKWCNARSEREGYTPCYSSSGTVYKAGQDAEVSCNWTANGYRLPTEAEWEKAARGGAEGARFPWVDVDTIRHSQANYYCVQDNGTNVFIYDVSTTPQWHPTYRTGAQPYTSPVGSFAPNGYGLYDMAGNVSEWCWDWYDDEFYATPEAVVPDTRGPDEGYHRLHRGGGWWDSADFNRVAVRPVSTPGSVNENFGLRLARSVGP